MPSIKVDGSGRKTQEPEVQNVDEEEAEVFLVKVVKVVNMVMGHG